MERFKGEVLITKRSYYTHPELLSKLKGSLNVHNGVPTQHIT